MAAKDETSCVTDPTMPVFVTPKCFALQLSSHLCKKLGDKDESTKEIRLIKRRRVLTGGEFFVPSGQGFSHEVLCKCKEVCEEQPFLPDIPIERAASTSLFALLVKLNRGTVFKYVLTECLRKIDKYGVPTRDSSLKQRPVVFLRGYLCSTCEISGDETQQGQGSLPLNVIRAFSLLSHVKKLLAVNGFDVTCVPSPQSWHGEDLLDVLEVECQSVKDLTEKDELLKNWMSLALGTIYTRKESRVKPEAADGDKKEKDVCITLDLRQFLKENPALSGYDRDINLVDVVKNCQPTDVLKEACSLERQYQQFKKNLPTQESTDVTFLHLSPYDASFIQQQMDLVWRILSPYSDTVKQVHLVHRGVATSPASRCTPTADSHYRHVKNEIREAAVMKYGSQVKGEGWERDIKSLTQATLKMEVLSAACPRRSYHLLDPSLIKMHVSQFGNCHCYVEECGNGDILSLSAERYKKTYAAHGTKNGTLPMHGAVAHQVYRLQLNGLALGNLVQLTTPKDSGGSKRCGTFVMYNCARLSTLLSHFNEAVQNGTYPALPPIEEVDFSVLSTEEWFLLFNFIWTYPDLVAETIPCPSLMPMGQISADIHTHKVCNFLFSLSQHFSAYYSKHHILGESLPHLYPVMFARLYLMKAVHQVMMNGLDLLDIKPLVQM